MRVITLPKVELEALCQTHMPNFNSWALFFSLSSEYPDKAISEKLKFWSEDLGISIYRSWVTFKTYSTFTIASTVQLNPHPDNKSSNIIKNK